MTEPEMPDTPASSSPADAEAAPQTWPAVTGPGHSTATSGLPPVAGSTVAVAVPTSSNAVVALILAIVSWAICPVISAIVALVFASMAAKEIQAGEGRIAGRGLVTAARMVAWINIGVMAATLVIGLLVVVIIAIASYSTN
ncbi:MAG: hypothetical protein ORN20_08370 [Candidatus Nanopelagicales bacterium]|nr:hypothetical protein [Candidatus Nanopelagicales bacterium]